MSSLPIQSTAQTERKLHKLPRHCVSRHPQTSHSSSCAAGFTILETVFAVVILVITIVGVMGLFASTFKVNSWQGDSSTRTIEYAQDKMESLLALTYLDSSTDTTVWPYCNGTVFLPGTTTPVCSPTANGTGLGPGGGTDPLNPVAGHFDYLTASGDVQTIPTGASYVRVWRITENAPAPNGTLKTITVTAASLNASSLPVSTTLVCLKSKQK